jgi:hypothetical protein
MIILIIQPRSQVNSTLSSYSTEPGLNLDPERLFITAFYLWYLSTTPRKFFTKTPRITLRPACGVEYYPVTDCIVGRLQCLAIYCRPAHVNL